jgi:predicted nucleotidyltransferase
MDTVTGGQGIKMATVAIDIPEAELDTFCAKWQIRKLELFGSVLRDDFRPDSDVDVLATFDATASLSLFDLVDAEAELQKIFGRPVDLLDRSSVERSENWIRRRRILESARMIYAR